MSLIFATQLTAVATAVLAVFAIVTAVVAYLAFRKQSREVGFLQDQVDEHRAALEREAADRHREQASRVWVVLKRLEARPGLGYAAAETGTGPAIEAVVVNGSAKGQPVYDARLYWYDGLGSDGAPGPELIGTIMGDERIPVRRQIPAGADPGACGVLLTFRDAAGSGWMRVPDGTLTEHAPGDLDRAARSAIAALPAPGGKANPA